MPKTPSAFVIVGLSIDLKKLKAFFLFVWRKLK